MSELSDSPLMRDQETQVNLPVEEESQAAAKEEAWDEEAGDEQAWGEEAGYAKAWDEEAGDEAAAADDKDKAGNAEARGATAKHDSPEADLAAEGITAQQIQTVDASVNETKSEVI